jgi:hypothetical protein
MAHISSLVLQRYKYSPRCKPRYTAEPCTFGWLEGTKMSVALAETGSRRPIGLAVAITERATAA